MGRQLAIDTLVIYGMNVRSGTRRRPIDTPVRASATAAELRHDVRAASPSGDNGSRHGRGRPLVDDKRRRILDAALRVFAARGYHATAVPAVAQAAGVGTGTLYRYFEHKEALVNEVYRDAKLRLRTALFVDAPGLETYRLDTAERWFAGLWGRLGVFAQAEPDAFRFLEMQDHVAYLDAASRKLELSVIAPLWMAGNRLNDRSRSAPVDVLIALLWGAFVGLVKASRLGYLKLDEANLANAGRACWRMIAPDAARTAGGSSSRLNSGSAAAPSLGPPPDRGRVSRPGAKAAAKAGAELAAKAGANPGAKAEAEIAVKAAASARTKAGAEAKPGAKPGATPDAIPREKFAARSQPRSQPPRQPAARSQTRSQTPSQPEAKLGAKPATNPEANAKPNLEQTPQRSSAPNPKPSPNPKLAANPGPSRESPAAQSRSQTRTQSERQTRRG